MSHWFDNSEISGLSVIYWSVLFLISLINGFLWLLMSRFIHNFFFYDSPISPFNIRYSSLSTLGIASWNFCSNFGIAISTELSLIILIIKSSQGINILDEKTCGFNISFKLDYFINSFRCDCPFFIFCMLMFCFF